MHLKKDRLLKSFIRSNDLLAGELSVWRLANPPRAGASLDEIVENLKGFAPANNQLHQVKSCTAEILRDLSIVTRPGRVVSIIDDCSIDLIGGKNPAHAVIAICEKLNPQNLSKESELFEEIRNKIHLAFAACTKWQRPAVS